MKTFPLTAVPDGPPVWTDKLLNDLRTSELAYTKKLRATWRPRLKECATQCPSCPFLRDNNAEFGEVVTMLRKSAGLKGKTRKSHVVSTRISVMMDVEKRGDFACHSSVYDRTTGKQKPDTEFRQCPGATKWYKEHA